MMRARDRRLDSEGMTLIELLIAVVIMGVAIVAMVAAMGSMIISSQHNRGQSEMQIAARDFGEAVIAKVNFVTKLTAAIPNATATSISVVDASGLPQSVPYDVVVDQETMTVTARSGNTLTVTRGVGDSSAAVSHTDQSQVFPLFVCAVALPADAQTSQVTNSAGVGYLSPDSWPHASNVSASISKVEYFDPNTKTFAGFSACKNYYDNTCFTDSGGNDVRPDCDPGLTRVTIVTTSSDSRLQGVTTKTQVLVRRGGA